MYASGACEFGLRLGKRGCIAADLNATGGGEPVRQRMNLRNLREVDTALVGMVFLMRRAVTTRDDGTYAYAGRAGYALLTRPPREPAILRT